MNMSVCMQHVHFSKYLHHYFSILIHTTDTDDRAHGREMDVSCLDLLLLLGSIIYSLAVDCTTHFIFKMRTLGRRRYFLIRSSNYKCKI